MLTLCTLSLPPENNRKLYGFQGLEKGCIGNEWVKTNILKLITPKLRMKVQSHILKSKISLVTQYLMSFLA